MHSFVHFEEKKNCNILSSERGNCLLFYALIRTHAYKIVRIYDNIYMQT